MNPWWLLLIIPGTVVLTAFGLACWVAYEWYRAWR